MSQATTPPEVLPFSSSSPHDSWHTDLAPRVLQRLLQLPGQQAALPRLLLQPQLAAVDALLPLGDHLQQVAILPADLIQLPAVEVKGRMEGPEEGLRHRHCDVHHHSVSY